MRYILFGAGETGKQALLFLGETRVLCFADNYSYGVTVLGKEVIDFQKLVKLSDDNIIVISSALYHEKMEQQLLQNGIKRYFVFFESHQKTLNDILPRYQLYGKSIIVGYTNRLSYCNISKYKNISIYGTNALLPYLISEIYLQNPLCQIINIITDDPYDKMDYMGIPCVNYEEASSDYDCIIINKKRSQVKNPEVLDNKGKRLIDIYAVDEMVPEFKYPELANFKDIHKGERLWLIGNGPSLRIEDLNKLYEKGEVCIAFNKMYKAFDKMRWRPNYYAITDRIAMEGSIHDIRKLGGEVFLADYWHTTMLDKMNLNDIHYFHLSYHDFYPNMPQFSGDITQEVFWGSSVVYDIGIQLAVYMGAKEIYLLGVDHDYPTNDLASGANHFIKNYYGNKEKHLITTTYTNPNYNCVISTKAFEMAKEYADRHEIQIYNVTRGGKLEVFERKNFDDVL